MNIISQIANIPWEFLCLMAISTYNLKKTHDVNTAIKKFKCCIKNKELNLLIEIPKIEKTPPVFP